MQDGGGQICGAVRDEQTATQRVQEQGVDGGL